MKFNTFLILFFCAASMFGQVSSSMGGSSMSNALQPSDTIGTVMVGSSQLPTGNAVWQAIGDENFFINGNQASDWINMNYKYIANSFGYSQISGGFGVSMNQFSQITPFGVTLEIKSLSGGTVFLGSESSSNLKIVPKNNTGVLGQPLLTDGSGVVDWGGNMDMEGSSIDDIQSLYINDVKNDAFGWDIKKDSEDLEFSYQSRIYRLNSVTETLPNDLTTKEYVDKAVGESEVLNANTTINTGTPKIKKIFGGTTFTLDQSNWQTGEIFILKNFSFDDVTLTTTGGNFIVLGSTHNTGNTYVLPAGQQIEIEQPNTGGIAYSITAPSVQAATNNFQNSYTLEKEILGFASGKQDNTSTIQARNCTISKISTGRYQVKFFEPHPDDSRYEVLFGATEDNNADVPKVWVEDGSETPDGLIIRVTVDDNGTAGDIARDDIFSFSINYIKAILTNGD